MAADLHVHVLEGITEDDLRIFFSNTLGSKHFSPVTVGERNDYGPGSIYDRVGNSPNVWIGEVSWLKAMLLEDGETFIPEPVQAVQELIGEDLPVLDDELQAKLLEALQRPNRTGYTVAARDDVVEFLTEHRGKKLFTVSW